MRRFAVLVRVSLREALSEPLAAVLFLSATLLVHLLPAFHYHQMGEPSRFPAECGYSALSVFGLAFALPAAVHAIGRELAVGTAAVAFACGVKRWEFFVGRLLGVSLSIAVFALAVGSATMASVLSAVSATDVREGVARVTGPIFAAGVGGTLVAFAVSAAANRFANVRFCAAACWGVMLVNVFVATYALIGFPQGIGAAWYALKVIVLLAGGVAAIAACATALSVVSNHAAGWAMILAVGSFFLPIKLLAPPEGNEFVELMLSVILWLVFIFLGIRFIQRKELP